MISLISVCRARLTYLREALSSWLTSKPVTEIIVVDAACTDGCGSWLRTNAPSVAVAEDPEDVFSLTRSRNIGARMATGNWLMFCDCDIVLRPTFAEAVPRLLSESSFMTVEKREQVRVPGLGGLLVCQKKDFEALGGYDELFQSWGAEDDDMVDRLNLLRRVRKEIPWAAIEHLHHPAALRVANLNISRATDLIQVNIDYLFAKRCYMILSRTTELTLPERQAIRGFVSAQRGFC